MNQIELHFQPGKPFPRLNQADPLYMLRLPQIVDNLESFYSRKPLTKEK
jgi:hypothetical protein